MISPGKRGRARSPSGPFWKSRRQLHALAHLHGVQTSYLDMSKSWQHASAETLLAVLNAMGLPIEQIRDVPGALRESRVSRAQRVLEPVHVAWRGQKAAVPFRLPGRISRGPLQFEWRFEDGNSLRHETRLERMAAQRESSAGGEPFVTRCFPLPARLPVGCHQLTLHCAGDRFETVVLSAPRQCFQGFAGRANRDSKQWGIFAPLYALHSDQSLGAGEFGDLAALIEETAEAGGSFVGTLPLLPAFLEQPCEPSPYSPLSRLFWNEFYLDLSRVPEISQCPAARRLLKSRLWQKEAARLRKAPLVQYDRQMALKRELLELLSRSFFQHPSARRIAFDRFLKKNPHFADYARFRAVAETFGKPWDQWPERMRKGNLREGDYSPSRYHYHLYVQWLAHQQMSWLSSHARRHEVALYLDMPLGVHNQGYDAWRYQQLFAQKAAGGAPPDPVFTLGQNWGFAPLHPQRSREEAHSYVRAYLRHHLQHARMLRFDHVMGLHRLYWVPCGLAASKGAYVTYPAEEFYAILCIESHRHQAVIVGENLGTVPPAVNRSLQRHGVSGMFVVQYEAQPQPRRALRKIPSTAVASLNTHDMPPFAAYWRSLDIHDRNDLGLIKRGKLDKELRLRARIRSALVHLLRRRQRLDFGIEDTDAVFQALTRHLAASSARWVLVNLEDLWLETQPQNTPGTTTQRRNWQRKARYSLEELRFQPDWVRTLASLYRHPGRARSPSGPFWK